jgi:hypothetical protein
MKGMNQYKDCEEWGDLKIAYMEDLLSPEESEAFEAHMDACAECRAQLEQARVWTRLLEDNRAQLCPELWRIFENREQEDPHIQTHISVCDQCAKDLEAFDAQGPNSQLPQELWQRMTGVPGSTRDTSDQGAPREFLGRFKEAISHMLWAPGLAFATAAAAIIVAVLLFPVSKSNQFVALSQVPWSSIEIKRELMGPGAQGPKAALMLKFKGFGQRPDQELADILYKALEPKGLQADKYDWVTPNETLKALSKKELDNWDIIRLSNAVNQSLQVKALALVTIEKTDRGYDLDAGMYEAPSGKALITGKRENVTRGGIIDAARALFDAML